MTTEEKLEHFYEVSIDSARTDAEQLLSSHTEALNKIFEEHKEIKLRQAEAELKAESDKLKKDFNKDISTRQLEIKRKTSAIASQLTEELFAEVLEKLTAFKKTPDYRTMLIRRIHAAFEFADGDDLTIYIDEEDAPLRDLLVKEVGIEDFDPKIAEDSFLGGIRAIIPSKNILIDESFHTLMRDEKEKFNLEV